MKTRWYDTLDSTNSEALRRIGEWKDMTVLAARDQTAGRGQRGNTWYVEPGQNLTFSIVLKREIPAADAVRLNILAPLCVWEFLSSQGAPCKVKWPNDVYAGRRKICGILMENSLEGGSVAASVIGIGINLNQTEFPQVANVTSLKLVTGKTLNPERALQEFMEVFSRNLPLLDSPDVLLEAYNANLFLKGETSRFSDYLREKEFSGVIEEVEKDGRIRIMDTDAGIPRRFRFKEVGYIL